MLDGIGLQHGFGLRGFEPPPGLRRPKQVHGSEVIAALDCVGTPPPEADAIVSDQPGIPVAVVTADCVPILLADTTGRVVGAVHAGWRGLAAGVIGCGVAALEREGVAARDLLAVIGPHIGVCCYEVDGPVLDAMSERFGARTSAALRATRPGHAMLDLRALANAALGIAGIPAAGIGSFEDVCTSCDRERFHSYRRDGARSGRMIHFIEAGVRLAEAATSRIRGQNQG